MQGKKGKRADEREIMSEIFNPPPSGKKKKKKRLMKKLCWGPAPVPQEASL